MAHLKTGPREALAQGWVEGQRRLQSAIASGRSYAFETTLGGDALPKLVLDASKAGYAVRVWLFGLASLELHQRRVQRRIVAGGYPIPDAMVRACWKRSRENLIALLPHLASLRLLDNSVDRSVNTATPPPRILLEMHGPQWIAPGTPADMQSIPDWAKPILEAAIQIHGLPAANST